MRHNSDQWDLQEAWRQLLGRLLPFLIKGGADPLGQPLHSSLECRCELQHSIYWKRPIKSQFIAHWFNFMLVTACLWIYYYMRKINSCLFQPLVVILFLANDCFAETLELMLTGNQLLKHCIPRRAVHPKVHLSYVDGKHQREQNPRQLDWLVKELSPLPVQGASLSPSKRIWYRSQTNHHCFLFLFFKWMF